MIIKLLTEDIREEYENFLHSTEDFLLYSSYKYKNFLQDLLECETKYLLEFNNNKINAAIPLMIKKGPFGNIINSLPYYGSNGGIVGFTKNKQLIAAYKDIVNAKDCITATLISSPFFDSITMLQDKITDQRISQITVLKTLKDPEDYLWSIIDSTTHRNIKKAKRERVKVHVGDESAIQFLEETHLENMAAISGKAKQHDFFVKFPKHFTINKDYKIIVATIDNIPVSALLVFYYNKTVEYYTPVIKKDFRDKQPLALILWETMLQAIKDGYHYWNWGGTWITQKGVYQFKKKWGAIDKLYSYSTVVNNQNVINMNREIFDTMYYGFYIFNFNKILEEAEII